MRVAALFLSAGSVLIWLAIRQKTVIPTVLLVWGGLCAFIMAAAYLVQRFDRPYVCLLGKRRDGTRSFWHTLLFLPLTVGNYISLIIYRIATREEIISEVAEGLLLSGRLLPSDERLFSRHKVGAVLDVAGDWQEVSFIRSKGLPYLSIPLLDGTAPSERQLDTGVKWVLSHVERSGNVLIHCAKGHGRSVIFVIALLLAKGHLSSIEQAFQMIKKIRPGAYLRRRQFHRLHSWLMGVYKGYDKKRSYRALPKTVSFGQHRGKIALLSRQGGEDEGSQKA